MRKEIAGIVGLIILLVGAGWLAGRWGQSPDSEGKAAPKNGEQSKLPDEYRNKKAVLQTNYGNITIAFFDDDAPKAVENFIRLSLEGKYDNSPFHRIMKGFMIQGGDYTNGNGTGGGSIWGAPFEDELDPTTESYKLGYKRGIVAMANAGPNTNGSQFFIMHADYPLPHNYTIFGQVIEGMDVVDKIADVPVLENAFGEPSVPAERVVIEKVIVLER